MVMERLADSAGATRLDATPATFRATPLALPNGHTTPTDDTSRLRRVDGTTTSQHAAKCTATGLRNTSGRSGYRLYRRVADHRVRSKLRQPLSQTPRDQRIRQKYPAAL